MMVGLSGLWMPILVSAVLVFIASSIIHMGPFWHRTDFSAVPNEEALRKAVGAMNIPAGDYLVPRPASMDDMKTDAYKAKVKEGPILIMTVKQPGAISMTANLMQWFVYSLVVGVFAAYVAGRALPLGAEYLRVFRFVGVTAFLGYSLALVQNSIWWSKKWSTTIKSHVDGLIYALVTAGAFGWLWPR